MSLHRPPGVIGSAPDAHLPLPLARCAVKRIRIPFRGGGTYVVMSAREFRHQQATLLLPGPTFTSIDCLQEMLRERLISDDQFRKVNVGTGSTPSLGTSGSRQ